jgi:aryl-alcohol dehydrogenase-like predicted oxidoreductase
MEYRNFGSTDLYVSRLGIGGSHFGSIANPVSSQEICYTLESALAQGINFYDTADIYGQGESERLIGKAFKKKRDQVVLATKGGFVLSRKGKFAARVKPLIKPLLGLTRSFQESANKAVLSVRSGQLDSQKFYLDPGLDLGRQG